MLLAACGSPNGDIQAEYSEIARKTGIIPVFPPKENIQVGDIMALSSGGANDTLREWIGEDVSVLEKAEKHMASRLVFRTTAGGTSFTENAPGQTDLFGTGFTRRDQERIESLPIVALPAVTADAGAAFGLGRASPLAALGLGFGARTKVRVDFGDVRSYGIPKVKLVKSKYDHQDVLRKAIFVGEQGSLWVRRALEDKYLKAISAGRRIVPQDERCLASFLITQVYLTRRIEYTFIDARFGALSAAQAKDGAEKTQTPDVPAVTVTVNQTAGEAPELNTTQLEKDLDALSTAVRDVNPGDGSATSFAFEGFSALGATFSQTYQRPVVVGYEGWGLPFGNTEEDWGKCEAALGLPPG
ncbi:hypothetical protein [Pacificoceanicola onchidii]|uniref:hypothetical protein n=1 Tax=Pacificoceanicola onchidii TaxID=2562685 RepID=UPI0010A35A78|nr:hypothetical protein [Pacificoceanicola onchidii]